MSWKAFDDNCPGCRPVILNPDTMKLLDPDSDIMRKVNNIWNAATLEEKQAFHNVCCNNSRDPVELCFMRDLCNRIESAIKDLNVDERTE